MAETPKLHASLLRRGDMSVAELRTNAKKLNELAAQLTALADNAAQEKVESLRIDGITKLGRGMELVRDFTANVTQSLFKAKFG